MENCDNPSGNNGGQGPNGSSETAHKLATEVQDWTEHKAADPVTTRALDQTMAEVNSSNIRAVKSALDTDAAGMHLPKLTLEIESINYGVYIANIKHVPVLNIDVEPTPANKDTPAVKEGDKGTYQAAQHWFAQPGLPLPAFIKEL